MLSHLYDHPIKNVFMGATAGMRVLKASNESASNNIINAAQSALKKYSKNLQFDPKDQKIVEILDGDKEGLFGWISANYLSGKIGPNLAHEIETVGALDWGGASSQITFSIPYGLVGIFFCLFSYQECLGILFCYVRINAGSLIDTNNIRSLYGIFNRRYFKGWSTLDHKETSQIGSIRCRYQQTPKG